MFVDIPGFDGALQASRDGKIRRADGLVFAQSKPRDRREYPCVNVRYNGRRIRVAVHTLMALTFVGPKPFPRAQVRHLDGDHLNPAPENLAWGTSLDNAKDRDRHGTTARGPRHGLYGKGHPGEKNGNARLTDAKVREIRALDGQMTQRALAGKFGVHQAVIWRVLRRRGWAHVTSLRAIAKGEG